MRQEHIITKDVGNLRGFSTDSFYLRPANVADIAINIQRSPDGTLQLRRGYQCEIGEIGGAGLGTFDDPALNEVRMVSLGLDGYLYNRLKKQIFFYYDGQVTGSIQGISNTNPAVVQSNAHGLPTGTQLIIRNVGGMTEVNNKTYTITFVDANHFSLNGIDSTLFSAYTSGGTWSIAFADGRFLVFTIFTDPRFLNTNPGWSVAPWSFAPWGAPSGESITCNITVNRAAQISGNQSNINTFNVHFGHELVATDIIQFTASNGTFQQRNVVSTTPTSITFDGYAVSVLNGAYVNQFFDIPFRKGFDVLSPYLISTFIATITDPSTGIDGLQLAINGLDDKAAAFIEIIEPTIIDSNSEFTIDYFYWQKINSTSITSPFPGTANIVYQNSAQFENAAMTAFDDVIYITNGWDFPQKYDGQTVYRVGMPEGVLPLVTDNTTFTSLPFVAAQVYQYLMTYEQIDTRGHIVEGEASEVRTYTVVAGAAAGNVQLTNLMSTLNNNWNTNGALAVGGLAIVYGPDINGFYYDAVNVDVGFTLKIGDNAYYGDTTCAVITGAQGADGVTIPVLAGHGILPGDLAYFFSTTGVQYQRQVISVTATSITVSNAQGLVVVDATHPDILVYLNSIVFGDISIVDLQQTNVNTVNVVAGHTILLNDIVSFVDTDKNIQRRTVTGVGATTVTLSGIPFSVLDRTLIASENQRTNQINLQRLNANGATLSDGVGDHIPNAISNNLRINIYRTTVNKTFANNSNGEIFLVASVPNDSSGAAFQTYVDGLPDTELGRIYDDPIVAPNPPPISKYVKAFGNQIFYGGGERNVAENSDRVFFSEGDFPESVPLASNFFNVPNLDDDVTGLGVAGTTLVVTKNHSLWAITGNFLSGNASVVQVAPGTNIGCVAHATIASVGTLMYFVHTNGVYAITENQLFPTDSFGNPIPLSIAIDKIFRETNFLPQTKFVFQRAVAVNYTKDNQYLLFIPCEDIQSSIRTANANSMILCYDYEEKNWFQWFNMNAAGGMCVIEDDLFFQERRFSGVDGNTANLYKQHRFYRLVDHADHSGPQRIEWRSSWEDLQQPLVRKKFCRCLLLMDRLSSLLQYNNPIMYFSSYLNRITNLQDTMVQVTQVDNIRNSSWSYSGWGWNKWSGYQDSFVEINLRRGTVAKSMQIGFTIQGINMDMRLAGFQLEIIPENRKTILR